MISDPHVLILSTIADVATDDVVRRLAARGIPHQRLNSEEYPFASALAFEPKMSTNGCWMASNGRAIPVPTAVWYRRLRTPPKPEDMSEGIYNFCMQESRALLLGSIMSLTTRWMSHPAAVWQSEYKPYQLAVASHIGLQIPPTIITNDVAAIRKAFGDFGAMIVKPVRTGHIVHEGQDFAIYTSQVLEQHLEELESAKWCPAIYQALVPKRFDLRITVVGHRVFAAAIHSQSDPMAMVDWRRTSNPALKHSSANLPQALTGPLLQLTDSLGLAFAAVDMIESTNGEYIFLEVNPSGQWLWLDDRLDLGISDAVAEWLARTTTI